MNVAIIISTMYSDEGRGGFPEYLTDTGKIDLRELEGVSCYCDDESLETIRNAVAGFEPEGIHIIDTGDYHYLSLLWMEKIAEPFCLVLIDNHPDDQEPAFGGLLSCGSWVAEARRRLEFMKADVWNSTTVPEGLPVYLSIDMDFLSEEYARTDWSQGESGLEELASMISELKSTRRIIGADICGGITEAKGGTDGDFAVNSRTRERIIELLRH